MISFDQISIRRGKKPLINDATLQLHPGFRVGLTGKNGTGKSTLFATLRGTLGVDSGNLTIPSGWVIAHMAQEVTAVDMSALDFALSGDKEWYDIHQQLEKPEQLSDTQLTSLHERYDNIDGFTAKSRAAQMLAGLGFSEADHHQPVGSFSGGWQMRLNLAKTLMCRSDLLLLDEPTNHLDLDAILWLEDWLTKYSGTLLLISHDQQFLNAVVSHILHIEHGSLTLYTGHYDQFLKVRAERLAQQEHAIKKQEATRAHLQNYIDRFRAKATKAKQAQSRIKQLERMQSLSPVLAEHEFSFSFYTPNHMGSPLLQLTQAHVGYKTSDKETRIIDNVNLQITPDTRLGLLGVNGAGKSTLIKTIVGELPLLAGKCVNSDTLKIGYFSQHKVDALEHDATPLLLMRRLAGNTSDADLRAFLGSFGFQGERIDTPVQIFSGGERARLNLAMIVWQRPNLLILDEPTNHLDISMKQALTLAIQNFTGALILVSHDRELISAVCDELYLVDSGLCEPFTDDISGYATWLRNKRKALSKEKTTNSANQTDALSNNAASQTATQLEVSTLSKEEKRRLAAKQRELTAPLRKQIKQLETELESTNIRLSDIETRLSDTSLYDEHRKEELIAAMAEQTTLNQSAESVEEHLLELMEQLEEAEANFNTLD